MHLTNAIYQGLDQKKDILLVFLDISKAFDRVWHPGLLHKLREFGISGPIYNWFIDYLSGRKQKVVLGGEESTEQMINAGVPQGSILGPLLFLIFINDIVETVENPMFLFADDSSLMKVFNDIDIAAASINRDLQHLTNWANNWRVTFNVQKTVFMIITKKTTTYHPEIKMNNTNLTQVYSERYLGMIINSNMSWKPHIDLITSKSSKRLGPMFKMSYKLPRSALSKYYISFIRPILEYGSVIYDSCTGNEARSLELVQRRAALLSTGGFKRTPSTLLLKEVGWERLADRRKKAKLVLLYKILHNHTPAYLHALIPEQVQNLTRYSLRNPTAYRIPHSRTAYMSNSFIPSSLKQWNSLDESLRNSLTLNTFKSRLKALKNPLCKLYSLAPHPAGRYLTQMRLGLSKLKSHLFTYSIIPDPLCPNCQNSKETTTHYLLQCPAYAAQRGEMLHGLAVLLPPGTMNNNRLLVETLLNGTESLTFDCNKKMHQLVYTYILDSNRFT